MRIGPIDFSAAIGRANPNFAPADRVSPSQGLTIGSREAQAPIATSISSAGSTAPTDTDRVREIRKALETDTYPLIPTEIADAVIAAGLYGRIAQ